MISFFQVFIQSKVNEREMKRQPQQQRSEETNQGAADFSEVWLLIITLTNCTD